MSEGPSVLEASESEIPESVSESRVRGVYRPPVERGAPGATIDASLEIGRDPAVPDVIGGNLESFALQSSPSRRMVEPVIEPPSPNMTVPPR